MQTPKLTKTYTQLTNNHLSSPHMVAKANAQKIPSPLLNGTKNMSQRDIYAKAMNAAQANGGSNGVGVGQ